MRRGGGILFALVKFGENAADLTGGEQIVFMSAEWTAPDIFLKDGYLHFGVFSELMISPHFPQKPTADHHCED